MPRADYFCAPCDEVVQDHVFSASVGAIAAAPDCPVCALPMQWIPQARFDLKGDGDPSLHGETGFRKFTVDVDGRPTQIDSLHTLRRVERESEQRFRNGEGEPLRFRAYSQGASNLANNTFGASGQIGGQVYASGERPTKRLGVKRHAQEPEVTTGPGVAKDGATALKG